jgi:hypothetical protein
LPAAFLQGNAIRPCEDIWVGSYQETIHELLEIILG